MERPCDDHSGVCARLKVMEKAVDKHDQLLEDAQKMFEQIRDRLKTLTFAVLVLCSLVVIAGIVGSEGGIVGLLRGMVGK